jgi:hypothetical protein
MVRWKSLEIFPQYINFLDETVKNSYDFLVQGLQAGREHLEEGGGKFASRHFTLT